MANYDVIVALARGPTGLACAIEAVRAGMKPLVIDKGSLCKLHLPLSGEHVFFYDARAAGDRRFAAGVCRGKADAGGGLEVLRRRRKHFELELRLFETVLRLDGHDGDFTVTAKTEKGIEQRYLTKKVVIATGYYDLPNTLDVPAKICRTFRITTRSRTNSGIRMLLSSAGRIRRRKRRWIYTGTARG